MNTAIDLSKLPPPAIVQDVSFEAVLADMKTYLIAQAPELEASLALESEPVVKILELVAYWQTILLSRINNAATAVMLPTATGADLDNLAALFGIERTVLEDDPRLRTRTQLALEGFSTAGPVGAYTFHALSADANVKNVAVFTPTPGQVEIVVLSSVGDGTPDAALLATVSAALNGDDVRPLTDQVSVVAAVIQTYDVTAILSVRPGPDLATVQAAAEAAIIAYSDAQHKLGEPVARSGLLGALHQAGVLSVALSAPANDIAAVPNGAAFRLATNLTMEVANV
jgi:phage-related baseplate assembly protein